MRKILYPGTFDPLTRGHEDIVKRAAGIFDQVIVAVAASASKDPLFELDERIALAQAVLADLPNVRVIGFKGLLVDLARAEDTRLVLRGLRAVSDFEYEFQLAGMNRMLLADLETVFLTPDAQYMFLSATMVREIARLGGDITPFVSPQIAARVIARLKLT
ncbi:MAG: pantetheine-phosphate adenylyltransferase [Betaproteobacteria bacterium]|nr:MAG: pantetheine-phosphate adenylyltransferase [Betaproteobacteria bacterium]